MSQKLGFDRAKLARLISGILVSSVVSAIGHATLINQSFEEPPQSLGTFSTSGITGWDGGTGVWHIPNSTYFLATAPDGFQIGYTNGQFLAQQSTNTLGVGANTVTCMGGRRHDSFSSSFKLKLWAGGTESGGVVTGGTLLASANFDVNSIPIDSFAPVTATYTAAANDPLLGQFLTVQFERTAGQQIDVDDVKLNSESAKIIDPTNVVLNLGRITSGDVTSLINYDGTPLVACKFFVPTVTSPFMQCVVTGTSTLPTVTTLKFRTITKMNNGGSFQQTLKLFNFVTSSYEETKTDPINTNYQAFGVNATGSVTRYLGPSGALQTQIQVKQVGFSAVSVPCVSFDLADWLIVS